MLCTVAEAAKLLGYNSRSQLYRLLKEQWLDDYRLEIEGKTYLNMRGPEGQPTLAQHIRGITQVRYGATEIIDFNPDQYLKDLAKRLS